MQPILARIMTTLCILALLVSCSSRNKKKQERAELYFGAGTQSLMNQEYTDALTNLLKANELDPENPEIINNLAMAYYFKGEKDLAVKALKKSLALKDNSDAKVNLASIHFEKGDLNTAEKLYRNVLKDLTYDKQARTLYNLGLIEMKRGKNVLAENYFRKSAKEDSSYCPAFFQLGMLNYNRRQFEKALKNFREATIGTCYDQPASHFYQGLSLNGLKRYHEAMMKFDEIDARFKSSEYAGKARKQILMIQGIDTTTKEEVHASRKVHEAPEF
jgi:type IV pilus assembly protein PilF